MKRLNIFILLLTFVFSSYTKKDIEITNFEYSRYVKPNLKSIVQSYKTLLLGLNPNMSPLSNSFDLILDIYGKEYTLPNNCYAKEGKSCVPAINSITEKLSSLTEDISKPLSYKEMKYLSVDDLIRAKNHLQKLKLQLIKIQDHIATIKLKLSFSSKDPVPTIHLKQELIKTIELLDIYLLALSDNRFREDLQNYLSSFITPVRKFILVRDRKEVFIQNINEFNIRLNTLVMRITKFNFPVDKKVKTLSNIIHNRWNNILKVSLITNPKR